jgi:hypothetical protein
MTVKTITCPDCGPLLRVARDPAASNSVYDYDIKDWQRRCKQPDLSPVRCLVRPDGTSPKN